MSERARRRRAHANRGGALAGFLAGLVTGLALAVIVAIFVARAPIPFVDRSDRSPERLFEPKSLVDAPDPNASLNEGAALPPTANPGALPGMPGGTPSATTLGTADAPAAGVPAASGQQYLLQAGAFRSSPEAENMKVRLALIGFEAQVTDVRIDGRTLYRVRIGPWAQLDAMNRVRARLAENGIDASVVRQP